MKQFKLVQNIITTKIEGKHIKAYKYWAVNTELNFYSKDHLKTLSNLFTDGGSQS